MQAQETVEEAAERFLLPWKDSLFWAAALNVTGLGNKLNFAFKQPARQTQQSTANIVGRVINELIKEEKVIALE